MFFADVFLSNISYNKPEARSQKPEARSQKPEARSQKPEARSSISIFLPVAKRYFYLFHSLSQIKHRPHNSKNKNMEMVFS
jgi:hypothetical protein